MAFSRTIRIRFRSYLPGQGFTGGGAPKQGKTNVRGQVQIVDYVRGGTSLTPVHLGLDKLDNLELTLTEPVRSDDPTNRMRSIVYSDSAQEFYVLENIHDFHQFYLSSGVGGVAEGFPGGNPVRIGEVQEVQSGADFTLSFDAFGDSAHDIELT